MAAEPFDLRHRQVLRLMANAPHGRADINLIKQFTTEIFKLIAAGLVEVHAETVMEGRWSENRNRVRENYGCRSKGGRRLIEHRGLPVALRVATYCRRLFADRFALADYLGCTALQYE
jgi:hypothetical protein